MIIDLRSDTVTKPGPDMLRAMQVAPIGDDVFSEDPSVNRLEELAADIFSMEAAVFCPSGTMTNQIAIKLHTSPGQEVICEQDSHVYIYEGGGIAFNSSCQARPIAGDRGKLKAHQIKKCINPPDIYKPVTGLVSIENSTNRGGGSYYELEELMAIKHLCKQESIPLHIDGARLFNALIAGGHTAQEMGSIADTLSICLSKGLGAPVGSLLLGSFEHINKARRIRKVLGGGMRQAGFMAAAGIFALENNIERLDIDHQHAKIVAAALLAKDFVGHMPPVETNIIIFEVEGQFTAPELVTKLAAAEVLCFAVSDNEIRFVFHLDVTPEMVERLIKTIEYL